MNEQQASKEEQRRKLPKMDWETFTGLLAKGIREFHNGGTRRRFVIGVDFIYVMYKTKPTSKTTTGIIGSDFVSWCRGYVKDGVMYDVKGERID